MNKHHRIETQGEDTLDHNSRRFNFIFILHSVVLVSAHTSNKTAGFAICKMSDNPALYLESHRVGSDPVSSIVYSEMSGGDTRVAPTIGSMSFGEWNNWGSGIENGSTNTLAWTWSNAILQTLTSHDTFGQPDRVHFYNIQVTPEGGTADLTVVESNHTQVTISLTARNPWNKSDVPPQTTATIGFEVQCILGSVLLRTQRGPVRADAIVAGDALEQPNGTYSRRS